MLTLNIHVRVIIVESESDSDRISLASLMEECERLRDDIYKIRHF